MAVQEQDVEKAGCEKFATPFHALKVSLHFQE
jgi:hypothetical protein